MAHTLGSGDKLARGAVKATYLVRDEKTISQKKWDEMFGDFDHEEFMKKDTQKAAATGKKEVSTRTR